jgi:hypothetical protein
MRGAGAVIRADHAARPAIGMIDISARPHVDPDILSFSIPFPLFEEMEGNVAGSFLEKDAWRKVAARLPAPG